MIEFQTNITIVGISGGSCSGKTTLAKRLAQKLGPDRSRLVFQDNFYIDQSAKFDRDGGEINFDHPDAVDFTLMSQKLHELKYGMKTEIPIYDFQTHSRKKETLRLEKLAYGGVVIVDGIHVLSQEPVRKILDDSVYIECSENIRFERRKRRDTIERGRTLQGVIDQFQNHVKPMHDQFVEPSKVWAKKILRTEAEIELFLSKFPG